MTRSITAPRIVRYALPTAIAVAGALLAGCSGGSSSASTSNPTPQPSSSSPAAAAGRGAPGVGGQGGAAASGTIAQVDASSMEVQNPSTGQSTVTYTAKTAITQQKKTTEAAVKVGSCIVARSTSSSTTSSGSITATTIQVTSAKNGSCTVGAAFGGAGFRGTRPSGAPSGFDGGRQGRQPSGVPSGVPTGSGAQRGGFGSIVAGKVTAVEGLTLTVASVDRLRGASSSPSPTPTTTSRTVTIASGTTLTTTAAVTAKALTVGLCAAAFGSTNAKGAVSATRIALSSPVSGSCTTTTFGPGGFRGNRSSTSGTGGNG